MCLLGWFLTVPANSVQVVTLQGLVGVSWRTCQAPPCCSRTGTAALPLSRAWESTWCKSHKLGCTFAVCLINKILINRLHLPPSSWKHFASRRGGGGGACSSSSKSFQVPFSLTLQLVRMCSLHSPPSNFWTSLLIPGTPDSWREAWKVPQLPWELAGGRGGQEPGGWGAHVLLAARHGVLAAAQWMGDRDASEGWSSCGRGKQRI